MLVCSSCSPKSKENATNVGDTDVSSIQDNTVNNGDSEAQADEAVKEETSEEQSKYVEYTYNQDLNVIEDIYRTFYEVFLYSYYDSDGDGIGDINGLITKLDYLNDGDDTTDTDLGINGIWLMPIMPSTTYHKYDVADY